MEWNEKLQNIIDYVENHLQRIEEPVDPAEITRMAECSYGFFQKVFSYMTGISFSDYIRYRKMTLAGYDLKSTDIKVVDLSYRYGYDSPTSFTKAFQQFHGISPKEARKTDKKLRIFPKMQISLKQQYSWRLEEKPSFRLVGKGIKISLANGLPYQAIPQFWSECQRNGTYNRLINMEDLSLGSGLFGFFKEMDQTTKEMDYFIMTRSNEPVPDDFVEVVVPTNTWAIFDCIGPIPKAIQNGWRYLHEEWQVNYPFSHAPCPELEWYSNGNLYDDDYLSQIWIPILRR